MIENARSHAKWISDPAVVTEGFMYLGLLMTKLKKQSNKKIKLNEIVSRCNARGISSCFADN